MLTGGYVSWLLWGPKEPWSYICKFSQPESTVPPYVWFSCISVETSELGVWAAWWRRHCTRWSFQWHCLNLVIQGLSWNRLFCSWKKTRLREVEQLAQRHTGWPWQGQDWSIVHNQPVLAPSLTGDGKGAFSWNCSGVWHCPHAGDTEKGVEDLRLCSKHSRVGGWAHYSLCI